MKVFVAFCLPVGHVGVSIFLLCCPDSTGLVLLNGDRGDRDIILYRLHVIAFPLVLNNFRPD